MDIDNPDVDPSAAVEDTVRHWCDPLQGKATNRTSENNAHRPHENIPQLPQATTRDCHLGYLQQA